VLAAYSVTEHRACVRAIIISAPVSCPTSKWTDVSSIGRASVSSVPSLQLWQKLVECAWYVCVEEEIRTKDIWRSAWCLSVGLHTAANAAGSRLPQNLLVGWSGRQFDAQVDSDVRHPRCVSTIVRSLVVLIQVEAASFSNFESACPERGLNKEVWRGLKGQQLQAAGQLLLPLIRRPSRRKDVFLALFEDTDSGYPPFSSFVKCEPEYNCRMVHGRHFPQREPPPPLGHIRPRPTPMSPFAL